MKRKVDKEEFIDEIIEQVNNLHDYLEGLYLKEKIHPKIVSRMLRVSFLASIGLEMDNYE